MSARWCRAMLGRHFCQRAYPKPLSNTVPRKEKTTWVLGMMVVLLGAFRLPLCERGMALFHSDAIGSLKMDAREFTRKIISYFASLLASSYGLFRQPENGFQKYILFVFMLLQIILRCFGIVGTLFAVYPTSTMQMPKELQPSRVRVPSLPHQWQSSSVGRARLFLHLLLQRAPLSGECRLVYR